MTTNRYTSEINKVLAQNDWTQANVTFVMVQLRQHIESKGLQETFKFLNLYCNWTLHTEINSSITVYRILEYITDSFINHNKDPKNSKWITDAVIEGLSLHKLLDDIIKIGQGYNISTFSKFLNLANWIPFASTLVDFLVEKPLTFPNPFNPTQRNFMILLLLKQRNQTTSIQTQS